MNDPFDVWGKIGGDHGGRECIICMHGGDMKER